MKKLDTYQSALLILTFLSMCYSFPQTTTELPENSLQQFKGRKDNSAERIIESSTSSINSQPEPAIRPRIPIAKPNFPRVSIPFVIAMWVFGTCLVKIALNSWPKLLVLVPESCCLILAGIAVGLIFYMTNTTVLSPLSSTIFFFCMLPPIILDAGYFMPNRPFFDHLGTILLFAVMGTIFNTICIGLSLWACGLSGLYGFDISLLETLIFSSLISAVDPVAVLAVFEEIRVDQVLYIIVFGESLLNDAVTVVLYNMFDSYISLGPENIETVDVISGFASFVVVAVGGTMIGVFWGFLTGFITKYTHRVLVIEPIFIFVMSYTAYINAEAFQMSGILSIMFCGITMKNYVAENVSPTSLTTVKYGLKMLSNGSESVIFMFLGITTINDYHEWNTAFILLTIFFCTLYRGLGVVLLTEFANYFRLHKLNRVEKFVMSYGGLRGAIAFALVLLVDPNRIPRQPLFATATISVVFFTVFIQGITIKPLVEFLKVKREEKREKTMNERLHEKILDYTMVGVVDILGQLSSNKIRDKFKQWDYAYIRPYLIREKGHHEPKILETYSKLTMQDAIEFARRNPSSWTVPSPDSFVSIFRSHTTASLFPSNDPVGDLDLGELSYKPSTKNLWDAETHHFDVACIPHRSKNNGPGCSRYRTDGCHSSLSHQRRKGKIHESSHKRAECRKRETEIHQQFNPSPQFVGNGTGGTKERKDSYENEGGILFVAHSNTCQDKDSDTVPMELSIEMPLPWKTDVEIPLQSHMG